MQKDKTNTARASSKLTSEIIQQQAAFNNVRVRHPALNEALESLLPLLTPHSQTNVVIVTGATGVGKSTLTGNLLSALVSDFTVMADEDQSAVPLVYVEAKDNGVASPGFKDLYKDILVQLQEPGLDSKKLIVEDGGHLRARPNTKDTTAALRRVLENALQLRKTKVLVIDEAAHLLKLGKGISPMDALKSLANTTGTKLVLVGSFDLLKLVTSHGQIARRTAIINFDRYHQDRPEDRASLKSVLSQLMRKWPCAEVPNFVAISDQLMEVSLGCIGLLKSLLLDASAAQLRNNGAWKSEFLLNAVKSSLLHKVIREEIEAGELLVRDAVLGNTIWNSSQIAAIEARMAA